MKKTSYHHGHLEEALVNAGVHEARETGSRNLGVTNLAKAVNVSPMAVYRHFENGESLKAVISQQAREELARRMASAMATETDVKRRFLAMGRSYIEFGLTEPGLFSVAFLDCDATPKREDEPSAWLVLHAAIVDLCDHGLIGRTDIDGVAALAWSTVHGFAVLAGKTDSMKLSSRPDVIEDLLARTWAGIIRQEETGRHRP